MSSVCLSGVCSGIENSILKILLKISLLKQIAVINYIPHKLRDYINENCGKFNIKNRIKLSKKSTDLKFFFTFTIHLLYFSLLLQYIYLSIVLLQKHRPT